MDINDLRGFAAVLVLLAFLGVCWWAFSPSRRKQFNDAAGLPFADDDEMKHEQTQLTSGSTVSKSSMKQERE